MEVCRPAVEQCGSANFVDQIFKMLKTEPKLFIQPDFNRNCVAFDDCVLDLDRWERIWQAVGYLLVPDQHGKAIILLQGRKHSGKSVLVNVVKKCFDKDLVAALSVNEFGRRFATSSLYGKKLCVDADLSDERLSREAVDEVTQKLNKL